MKHGSLFSGLGGFDLAAEWMGWENIFHCEWMEFPRKVLDYHFPNADSHIDICKTDFKKYANEIDILTGGFPCQPFSMAGKRKGTDDERYLWGEMLRAIQEIKPTFVIAENVAGILSIDDGLVFEQVCLDLEAEGYEVHRLFFQLQPKTLRTEEIESGSLLPTPTAMNSTNATATMKSTQVKEGSMHSVTLNRAMSMGMLPTPTAGEHKHGKTEKYWENRIQKERQEDLSMMAYKGMLPTPTAYDWNTPRKEETFKKAQQRHKKKGVTLQNPLKQMASMGMLPTPCTRDYKGDRTLTDGKNITMKGQEMGLTLEQSARIISGVQNNSSKNSQLNPRFVAEMMGFPPNWTELPFLNGEQNQSKDMETQ